MIVKNKLRHGATHTNKLKKNIENELSFLKRRYVCEGFPLNRKLTYEERIDYFSHEKIVCLMCGKEFNYLHWPHLKNIHNISTDEYKEKFGLAFHKGLCGSKTRKRKSEFKKENPTLIKQTEEQMEGIRKLPRRESYAHSTASKINILNTPSHNKE